MTLIRLLVYNLDTSSPDASDIPAEHFFTRFSPSYTPAGTDVTVQPANGVELTFDQVTSTGNTTVVESATPPPVGGFQFGDPPVYYDISTTAQFAGQVIVCMAYNEASFIVDETALKLMHFHGEVWTDITSSLDTTNNLICGLTTSFSGFGVVMPASLQGLINQIQSMNLQQGIQNSLDKKLQEAQSALEASRNNDSSVVHNKLTSFINEAEAQRGRHLTDDQAATLINTANNLLNFF